jgi:hypothetical protein
MWWCACNHCGQGTHARSAMPRAARNNRAQRIRRLLTRARTHCGTPQDALSRYKNLSFLPGSPSQPCRGSANAASAVTSLSISLESEDETLGPNTVENYTLVVTAPVATLTAATVFGALRGLETFAQLTFGGEGTTWQIPSVSIQDGPRFGCAALPVPPFPPVSPFRSTFVRVSFHAPLRPWPS